MNGRGETERVRRFYDESADRYDRFIGYSEKILFGDGRRWVCAQASGNVLEIAVGTGRNLPYYAKDVRLTGVDISPAMLAVAAGRADDLGRDVELRVGDAQALDLPNARFDTVVSTLTLCTIPDDRRAVAEAWRVLRPGGRFLLLEHVRSPILAVRVVQRLFDPIFVRFSADHLLRDPLQDLTAQGFIVERLERSKWGHRRAGVGPQTGIALSVVLPIAEITDSPVGTYRRTVDQTSVICTMWSAKSSGKIMLRRRDLASRTTSRKEAASWMFIAPMTYHVAQCSWGSASVASLRHWEHRRSRPSTPRTRHPLPPSFRRVSASCR